MSKEQIKSFVNRWPILSRRLHIHMENSSFGPQTYFELECILEMKTAESIEASKVGSTIKEWYQWGYRWLRHFQEGLAIGDYEDNGELKELNSLFGPVFVAGEYVDTLDEKYNHEVHDRYVRALQSVFDEEARRSDE